MDTPRKTPETIRNEETLSEKEKILEKYKLFSRKFAIINERIHDFMIIMKNVDKDQGEFIINSTPLWNFKAEDANGWVIYKNNGFIVRFPYKGEEYQEGEDGKKPYILGAIEYEQNKGPIEYIIPAIDFEKVSDLPRENFEGQRSEEMLNKYIAFCDNLIRELNNINQQVSKLVGEQDLEQKYSKLLEEE